MCLTLHHFFIIRFRHIVHELDHLPLYLLFQLPGFKKNKIFLHVIVAAKCIYVRTRSPKCESHLCHFSDVLHFDVQAEIGGAIFITGSEVVACDGGEIKQNSNIVSLTLVKVHIWLQ